MRDAKQGGGSVINISPVLGLNRGQLPGFLAYTSSKIALDMVTKGMKYIAQFSKQNIS
ncbi:hypothetical protein KY285_009433 [Solanum tuberosum]|nr:hypothetical protein KY285_009433 [Solanum tuberosum]